jgi:histidine phosphotransferase ChpT
VKTDIRITQLLCSRLCHDLISPAGAVNTGLELLGEDAASPGVEMDARALAMTRESAARLTQRLTFYRVAFGLGGGDGVSALADARTLAADFLAKGKVIIDWPEDGQDMMDQVSPLAVKLLLNLVLLGAEALPRGGSLGIKFAAFPEGLGVAITAEGQGACIKEALLETLSQASETEKLTNETIQGYFTKTLAEHNGVDIEITNGGDDRVCLATLLPHNDGANG